MQKLLPVVIIFLLLIGFVTYKTLTDAIFQKNQDMLKLSKVLVMQAGSNQERNIFDQCPQQPSKNLTPTEVISEKANECVALSISLEACINGDTAQAEQWFSQARQSCGRQELLQAWGGHLAWAGGDRRAALEHWRSLPRGGAQYLATLVDLVLTDDVATLRYLLEEGLLPQASELGPAQVQKYYALLAGIYQNDGNWPQIAGLYDEATVLAPDNAVLWIRLGQARRLNGELDEANKAYDMALGLVDENDVFLMGWTYEGMSLLQQEQGSTSESVQSLKRAIGWFEKSPRITPERLSRLQTRLQELEASLATGPSGVGFTPAPSATVVDHSSNFP